MEQFTVDMKQEANELNLLNLIESRIMEIITIEDDCKRKLPKLFSQRLPRFVRRRAGCHNIKRLPQRSRPPEGTSFGTKDRKSLMKYRRRLRFRKHKRIIKKYSKHTYSNPFKCLIHKWFAKRFKMENNIPMFNNTKNQRNLYRQTCYGCAYISLGHLIPIRLTLNRKHLDQQLEHLNSITKETAGFTFCAKSLQKGNYEIIVHLYKLNKSTTREYRCPALVSLNQSSLEQLILWVPKENHQDVYNDLISLSDTADIKIPVDIIYPKDWTRIRLVGPNAFIESMKLAEDKEKHKVAIENAKQRLNSSFGLEIGSYFEESQVHFTFYNTRPSMADIVLKSSSGRLLWHKLIKNKAHLVGGYRDYCRLVPGIVPDN